MCPETGDPAGSTVDRINIKHAQFVYGLGPVQFTETAQTLDCPPGLMGSAEMAKLFGDAPKKESERQASPSAYAMQPLSRSSSTGNEQYVVLTRQLLSDVRDKDRDNTLFFQEHYVIIDLQEFSRVDSFFGNLIGQWEFHGHIPVWRQYATERLSPSQNVRSKPVQDWLVELRDRFRGDRGRLKTLFSALLLGQSCTITNFPNAEEDRLNLIECLVLLLPQPLRPQVSFATRVFGIPSESLRITLETSASRRSSFDWGENSIAPPVDTRGNAYRYADEIVEMIYEDGLLEELTKTPNGSDAVQKLRDRGGPALAAGFLDSIDSSAANLKLGNEDESKTLYRLWEQATKELLDSWRVATGRDNLSTRQRHLNKGGTLEPKAWIKTMLDTFNQLRANCGTDLNPPPRTLLVAQLSQPELELRKQFENALTDALKEKPDRNLAPIKEIITDRNVSSEVRNLFLRAAAAAAADPAQARDLLKLLEQSSNWNETSLKIAYGSPGLDGLLGVKPVLERLLGDSRSKDVVAGKRVVEAYISMKSDGAFLYNILEMALKVNCFNIIDHNSLGIVRNFIQEKKWQDLCENILASLTRQNEPCPRWQPDVDTWTEISYLAQKVPRTRARSDAMLLGVAACLAQQHPLPQSITDAIQEIAQWTNHLECFNWWLNSKQAISEGSQAILLKNLVELLQIEDVRKSKPIITLILARATDLATALPSGKIDCKVFFRLMSNCAAQQAKPADIKLEWIPKAFAAESACGADSLSIADGFGQWVSAFSAHPEQQALLFDCLRDSTVLASSQQVQIYDHLILDSDSCSWSAQAKIYLSEALADHVDQLIRKYAEGTAQQAGAAGKDPSKYLGASRWNSQFPPIETVPINVAFPVKPHHVDTAYLFKHWRDLLIARPPSEFEAYHGLMMMEKRLLQLPSWVDSSRVLMCQWAERLPRYPLRRILEQTWIDCIKTPTLRSLMCDLLEQYSVNILRIVSREERGVEAISTIWWLFGYLRGIGHGEVEAFIGKLSEQSSTHSYRIAAYLCDKIGAEAINGSDLICGYEKELGMGSHQNPNGELKVIYLLGVLSKALSENKTAFIDPAAITWLAKLLDYLQAKSVIADVESDFRDVCSKLLNGPIVRSNLREYPPIDAKAAADLAKALHDWSALAKIAAVLVPKKQWQYRDLRDSLNGVPEANRRAYLEEIIHALDSSKMDATSRLGLYRDLAKGAGYAEWSQSVMVGALQLLAEQPLVARCPLDELESLVNRTSQADPSIMKSVKQNAYSITEPTGQHGSQRPGFIGSPRLDYLAWMLEGKDKDLLMGLSAAVSDPILQVLYYGQIWREIRPVVDAHDGRLTKWFNTSKSQLEKRVHSPRTLKIETNPSLANHASELEFEEKLIELWSVAAEAALAPTDSSNSAANRFSTAELSSAFTETLEGLVFPEYSRLCAVADAMSELLLQYHWMTYFGKYQKLTERIEQSDHIANLVEVYLDADQKAKAKTGACESRFHSGLKRAWTQSTLPLDEALPQIKHDIDGSNISRTRKDKVKKWIQCWAEEEARNKRGQALSSIISDYKPMPTVRDIADQYQFTRDELKVVRDHLRQSGGSTEKIEDILAQMRRDHAVLGKLVGITESVAKMK